MRLKIVGVRGPKNRTFLWKGGAYKVGDVMEVSEKELESLVKEPGIWVFQQEIVEPTITKLAPPNKNKMLKSERNKDGTASERAGDTESGQGLSLDCLG